MDTPEYYAQQIKQLEDDNLQELREIYGSIKSINDELRDIKFRTTKELKNTMLAISSGTVTLIFLSEILIHYMR